MSQQGRAGGGERQGDREVIAQHTQELIGMGVKRDKAEQMARQGMVNADRKLREQGRR